MFNKQLIAMVGESKKVHCRSCCLTVDFLLANIVMMWEIAHRLQGLYEKTVSQNQIISVVAIAAGAVVVRFSAAPVKSHGISQFKIG